jgi:hypothetical protein
LGENVWGKLFIVAQVEVLIDKGLFKARGLFVEFP